MVIQNTPHLWEQGLQSFRAGDMLSAKEAFKSLLEIDPEFFDALYLYAAIASQEKDYPLAVSLLKKAWQLRPEHIEACFNLAVMLDTIGEKQDSLDTYIALIKISPNHLQAHHNLASLLAKQGMIDNAILHLERVLQIDPSFEDARNHYVHLKTISSRAPEIFICNIKDLSTADQVRFEKLHNEGLSLYDKRDFINALAFFNQALELDPESIPALHNLGMVFEKMGRLHEALSSYERVILMQPGSSPTLNNLGNVYRELGMLDKAKKSFLKAIELKPDYAEAFNNLGWTHYTLREFEEAANYFQKALLIKPSMVETKYNLSLCQLILGDYETGWLNYEYRKLQPGYQHHKLTQQKPLWLGEELITNKTIYIYPEQGFGDTIQFSRYIQILANKGASVLFEPGVALSSLFQNLEGVGELIKPGQPIPNYDFHCSLMSLPLALKTTLQSIPNQIPYIKPDPRKIAIWVEKLSTISGPKVGLVWSGGFRPNQPELWELNKRRNIPFECISQINLPQIQFFSLQKGKEAEEELSKIKDQYWPNQNNFHNFTNQLVDFSDTAALITQLDLVISVDTSTAHLAAAIGKPVWILNRYDSCWRWLVSGENSPWYPNVKLYRKSKEDNWESMIREVRQDLGSLFNATT
jgi:tetratricopeptide (TPR) repeat protein